MFFIASLPRTRTYWLARYCDGLPGVTCHHELLNGITDKQQFYAAMEQPGQVGDSDCGLYITDFQARWPEAPVLIVDRSTEDVFDSLCELFRKHQLPPPRMEQLEEQLMVLKTIKALHVNFEDLDSSLPEIHEYLGLGTYDSRYAEKMRQENLQLSAINVCPESYTLWIN